MGLSHFWHTEGYFHHAHWAVLANRVEVEKVLLWSRVELFLEGMEMAQQTTEPLAEYLAEYPQLNKALCKLPPSTLDFSGRFLYSDITTLRPGKFYILGHHPGGDPNKYKNRIHLVKEIPEWACKRANAILHEKWDLPKGNGFYPIGEAPYQLNVKALCGTLGICPCQVCTSNLYFKRKKGTLPSRILTEEEIKAHLSVHEAMLNIVKPDYIFAIGVEETYPTIGKSLLHFPEISRKPRGCEGYRWYVTAGLYKEKQITLIGLPIPNHNRELTYYREVLKEIAKECSIGPRV